MLRDIYDWKTIRNMFTSTFEGKFPVISNNDYESLWVCKLRVIGFQGFQGFLRTIGLSKLSTLLSPVWIPRHYGNEMRIRCFALCDIPKAE